MQIGSHMLGCHLDSESEICNQSLIIMQNNHIGIIMYISSPALLSKQILVFCTAPVEGILSDNRYQLNVSIQDHSVMLLTLSVQSIADHYEYI